MFSTTAWRLESETAVQSGTGYAWRTFHSPPLSVFDSRKPRRSSANIEQIEALIAKVLGGDRPYQRYSDRIRLQQRRLKLQVSGPAWKLYLLLEEAEVARLTHAVDRLAERALACRRSRR